MIDRWGRRPVLFFSTALTCGSILIVLLASANTPAPGWVIDSVNSVSSFVGRCFGFSDWRLLTAGMPVGGWCVLALGVLLGSAGWTGVLLAQAGVMLGFSESAGRSKYVAASAVLISMGGILGGVLGGLVAWALSFLQDAPILLGSFCWNQWHATFALSFVFRVLALILLIPMPDPGAATMRDIASRFRANVYNNVATRFFLRLRLPGGLRNQRRGENNKKSN